MANNFTFKDASGTTLTAKSTDASSVHIPANQVVDSSGNAPTDDGAAAGPIYPVAGLYQALGSVDEIDTGDLGRLRATARRASVTAPDYQLNMLHNTGAYVFGDCLGNTTSIHTAYSTLTTAFFDGTDAGFTAATRWVQIPMAAAGWKSASIHVYHNLGVNCDFQIYGDYRAASTAYTSGPWALHTAVTVATAAAGYVFTPAAVAAGASSMLQLAALAEPISNIIIAITPASDPSSGALRINVIRRT